MVDNTLKIIENLFKTRRKIFPTSGRIRQREREREGEREIKLFSTNLLYRVSLKYLRKFRQFSTLPSSRISSIFCIYNLAVGKFIIW